MKNFSGLIIILYLLVPCLGFSQSQKVFCKALSKVLREKLLTFNDIDDSFNKRELRILRNSVFAKHGRPFNSPELNALFYSSENLLCDFQFKVQPNYSDSFLRNIDLQNIEFIKYLEQLNDAYLTHENILEIDYPTTINNIISKIGYPYTVFTPAGSELSPIGGQEFIWSFPKQQVVVKAITDDYSDTPNYKSNIKLMEIYSYSFSEKEYKTSLNFILNKSTKNDVVQKIGSNPYKGHSYDLKYKMNNFWYYFDFDNNNKLIGLAKSILDIEKYD